MAVEMEERDGIGRGLLGFTPARSREEMEGRRRRGSFGLWPLAREVIGGGVVALGAAGWRAKGGFGQKTKEIRGWLVRLDGGRSRRVGLVSFPVRFRRNLERRRHF